MFRKAITTRFAKDERGTVVILWGTAMVAFIGFFAITLDVGRLSSTHAELQSFADNVALAAAAELDGQPDALTRSTNAAVNLISRNQTFADGARTLSGAAEFTLTFYSALPASDEDPLEASDITTEPRLAKFAHVALTPRSLSMNMASALNRMVGGDGFAATNLTAEAVAGFAKAACDIAPLMFCLPPNWETDLTVGDQILLRSGGGGGGASEPPWGPGNFGFIDLELFGDVEGACENEGGNQLACLIAAQEAITQCVLTNGFDTEPGQKEGITTAAFNTRFDMFGSTLSGGKNKEIYAPAPNVIKGIHNDTGGACIQGGEDPTPDTIALGRDNCFGTDTCAHGNRFGNGSWDRQAYLNANHDLSHLDANPDGVGSDLHLPPLVGTNAVFAGTRYGMYLREIAYGNDPLNANAPSLLNPSLSETGRPICSSHMSSNPARRVVNTVGVDCAVNPVSGKTKNVPASTFISVFLTEPVGADGLSPPNFDIYGEIVGFPEVSGVGNGGNGFGGIFRDVVQLYR